MTEELRIFSISNKYTEVLELKEKIEEIDISITDKNNEIGARK